MMLRYKLLLRSHVVIEDLHREIIESVDFTAMDKFTELIQKSVTPAFIAGEDNPNMESISLKLGILLEGLSFFANSKGKELSMKVGADTLLSIVQALQFEMDPEEAFLLFSLRNLGKFRKKESDLHKELKAHWKKFPEYEMGDQDFSHSLKSLMRDKFIQYRKGSIHLNPSFVIRYKV
jgi:hypothetical protein